MIILTFVRGDRDVCDQCVQLVWRIFIFITFPGETHTHAVRHVPEKHDMLSRVRKEHSIPSVSPIGIEMML